MILASPVQRISLMLNLLTADIRGALRPDSQNHLVITAGNTFRSDDGLGPYIASQLKEVQKIKVIDAGFTPENIVDEAIRLQPETIVFIDAANFGGTPGEVRIISEELIPETALSTHQIPLNVISKLIANSTQASVSFVGIQAAKMSLGEGLSEEVKQSAEEIINFLNKGQPSEGGLSLKEGEK
jgi:hydrogenase maturation protease HycI